MYFANIDHAVTLNREVRGRRKLDTDGLRAALLQPELCDVTRHLASADEYFHLYHEVLQRLADQFPPVMKITTRRQYLASWMDDECRQIRRKSRMLEHRYRRSKQSSDRQNWVEHERMRHPIHRQKEQSYWSVKIAEYKGQPKKLWQTFTNLLVRNTGKSQDLSTRLLNSYLTTSVRK